MPLEFSHPWYLLTLPLLFAFFVWCGRQPRTEGSGRRSPTQAVRHGNARRVSLLCRCLLALLLVLALAGFRTARREESLTVLFLVDASKSVRGAARAQAEAYIKAAASSMRSGDKAGVMTFAAEAHLQAGFGQPLAPFSLRDMGVTTATDIGNALRQAASELELAAPNGGRRIVLLSDSNENIGIPRGGDAGERAAEAGSETAGETGSGGALAAMPRLNAAHVLLDTLTLPSGLQTEALVDKITLPARVKVGEPFQIRATLRSLTAQTATVSLWRDGKPMGQGRAVGLHAGKNTVTFDQKADRQGFFRYAVSVDAPEDTLTENNRSEGFVWAEGKPSLLYVADSPALTAFLRRALQSFDIRVTYATPQSLPASVSALQSYDSVFLSNVPANALSRSQMLALQSACRDFGLGLGMIGGEDSFGAGGYRGTPIEAALPVSLDVRQQKRLPSVAVALVIEDLEIPTSVNMSIEAAKATMDLLEPIDQVGVLDCNASGGYGSRAGNASPAGVWRIPMQRVIHRDALKAAMQNLRDMGDPPSYLPFLAEAARVLNQTDAKVKHIVFLGDGDAEYENVGALKQTLQRLREQGITLSTIETGATRNADRRFMADMASMGGGQAYHAERPQELPRLLLRDQQAVSSPPFVEEPVKVAQTAEDTLFRGIDWTHAPPLLGYNVTSLKPTAQSALRNADSKRQSDPIFASWRYGLGRVAAFMGDDRARWGAAWQSWPEYARFWAQAARWTCRTATVGEYSAQATLEGSRGHIRVDARTPQGKFVNGLNLHAAIASPDASGNSLTPAAELPLRQTAPGIYEGWFEAEQVGTYLVNGLQKSPRPGQPDTSLRLGVSQSYSPEYRETLSNPYLMARLAKAGEGRAEPLAGDVFGRERPGVYATTDAAPWLMALSLPLLLLDIAVRRLTLFRRDPTRIQSRTNDGKAQSRLPNRATPLDAKSTGETQKTSEVATEETGMSRLLAAKRRAQKKRDEDNP